MPGTSDEEETQSNRKYLIIFCGLVVHILLLMACFDLYFASPLDHGMTPIKSTENPPAKRLVLFVADGLRAEAIYGLDKEHRIPFLSNIKKTQGSWGVSHTRVPTESRPGHVAMLGGIYEDPSAILKGWKANPVEFDSVINQSSASWSWGSPDIVTSFNKDNAPHIHQFSYGAELEDFGNSDTEILDNWVFNKVEIFLEQEVKKCQKNCEQFHRDGNFFFLHLLGIDTAGHGYKPHSKEYINNIKFVDGNIERITKLFQDTFGDDKTAFVFTSDHGMTDWGSHGAGSLHETEAPIIAWGAGVKINENQQDLKQVDIAPLLASLIGINYPIHSLGILPRNYLNVDEKHLANMQLSNMLQLLEIFNIKRIRTEDRALYFVPYNGITSRVVQEKKKILIDMLTQEDYETFQKECDMFTKIIINGLDYYHNYYQMYLLTFVTIGFLAWMCILFFFTIPGTLNIQAKPQSIFTKGCFILILVFIVFCCAIQKFSLTYYLYSLFPVGMIYLNLNNKNIIKSFYSQLISSEKKKILEHLWFYFIGIELLFLGFSYRSSYSLLMVLLSTWVSLSNTFSKNNITKWETIFWSCNSLILAPFPLLPVMKTSFNVPVYVAGFIVWLGLFYTIYVKQLKLSQKRLGPMENKVFVTQFFCMILAGLYALFLEYGLIVSDSNIKCISWLLMMVPIVLIPFTSNIIMIRLTATTFGFAPFYLLVSSNIEVLFSAFYVTMLYIWLIIESKLLQNTNQNLLYLTKFDDDAKYENKSQVDSFRRGFLFMVFIFVGFFGTGNIASMNSFDPMWTRAFLTVFSPFKMMALILLKIMVPFIFTCCAFRGISSIGENKILRDFCIILWFSDVMVLQFLYFVTNQGSWLDIGTSLSHFIIMEAFVIILLVLYFIAHLLTSTRIKYFVNDDLNEIKRV